MKNFDYIIDRIIEYYQNKNIEKGSYYHRCLLHLEDDNKLVNHCGDKIIYIKTSILEKLLKHKFNLLEKYDKCVSIVTRYDEDNNLKKFFIDIIEKEEFEDNFRKRLEFANEYDLQITITENYIKSTFIRSIDDNIYEYSYYFIEYLELNFNRMFAHILKENVEFGNKIIKNYPSFIV